MNTAEIMRVAIAIHTERHYQGCGQRLDIADLTADVPEDQGNILATALVIVGDIWERRDGLAQVRRLALILAARSAETERG